MTSVLPNRSLLDSTFATFEPKAAVARPRRALAAAWFRRHGARVRATVVSVVAFGCPTAAAYTWHLWAGLVATGAAVLLIDWAIDLPGSNDV